MALSLPLHLVDEMEDEEILLLAHSKTNYTKKVNFKILYGPVNFEVLTSDECWLKFRFRKPDILRLQDALGLPDYIVGYNGTKMTGLEGLLLLLRRLSYPNRLSDLCPLFGRNEPELSIILNKVLDIIYEQFGHLLSDFDQDWLSPANLSRFTRAVQDRGAPLDRCWGFIDGTTRAICRPGENQRLLFSGHKRVHALKFQSIQAPNGLIANLFGPFEGSRHDAAMLAESGVVDSLQDLLDIAGNEVYVYGDPAYPVRPCLMAPFRGAQLTVEQQHFNRAMATVRQSVEWGFGQISSQFAFLDFRHNQKRLLQPIGKYYIIGALLNNCKACLYGNQISEYFELNPPSLQEYLQLR